MATATDQLRSVLGDADLGDLSSMVWDLYREGYEFDYIYQQIVESDVYKTRFSGLVKLRDEGKAAGMDEGQYLEVESSMRRELEGRGFGGTSYVGNDYLGQVIGNDVSAEEFRSRVQIAEAAASTLPADVRAELLERYGVNSQNVLEYYLDTDATQNRLLREQQAASLAVQYERFQTMEVGTGVFEDLAREVTNSPEAAINAQQQMAAMGTLGGGLTDQERLRGALGLNDLMEAQRRARRSRFDGGGSAAATEEGIGGLSSAVSR